MQAGKKLNAGRDHAPAVRVLATLFRGKCLAALKRAGRQGEIATDVATDRALAALSHTPWVVSVKRPVGGAARLVQYLGRYTHRVGLSNQWLVAIALRTP